MDSSQRPINIGPKPEVPLQATPLWLVNRKDDLVAYCGFTLPFIDHDGTFTEKGEPIWPDNQRTLIFTFKDELEHRTTTIEEEQPAREAGVSFSFREVQDSDWLQEHPEKGLVHYRLRLENLVLEVLAEGYNLETVRGPLLETFDARNVA